MTSRFIFAILFIAFSLAVIFAVITTVRKISPTAQVDAMAQTGHAGAV
jgi:hypothetical protein